MDERVAKLKTSMDARQFAQNAKQRGYADVAAQALVKARELQAFEEGHQSPAQIAIATALYAYEEEQSRLTGKNYRANRTRQMVVALPFFSAAEHGLVLACIAYMPLARMRSRERGGVRCRALPAGRRRAAAAPVLPPFHGSARPCSGRGSPVECGAGMKAALLHEANFPDPTAVESAAQDELAMSE